MVGERAQLELFYMDRKYDYSHGSFSAPYGGDVP